MKETNHEETNHSNHDIARETKIQAEIIEDIITDITDIKALYNKTIQEAEEFLKDNVKALKTYKIKDEKKRELKKCLRRLKERWNDVKRADIQVKTAIDDLIDFKGKDDVRRIIKEDCLKKSENMLMTDYEMIPNMGFLKKYSRNTTGTLVSAYYQRKVFHLLYSFLYLHQCVTSFLFHQADIVCIMESDSSKKDITLNEFISKIFEPELTRAHCAEIIEEQLKIAGITKIPICSILKQLSSWNVYIASNKEKGTKPLPGYEIKRLKSGELFKKWVINTYLPDFRRRHRSIMDPLKYASRGAAAQDMAAEQQYNSDPDKPYKEIDKHLDSK